MEENVLPTKNNLKCDSETINCDWQIFIDERSSCASMSILNVIDALKKGITLYYNKRNNVIMYMCSVDEDGPISMGAW